jgi:D-arabinose 1-dehydrogenase-like Zn-dependent alcohol dehydrogenase
MGFNTIAIGRGKDEEELVKRLGARQYIDSRSQNAVEELTKLGGAKVILGTVPSGKAMSPILGGLAVNGKLIMIGVSEEPVEVPPALYVIGRRSLV